VPIRTHIWSAQQGRWKPVFPAYIWVSGAWRTVQNAWVWDNGAWRQCFEPVVPTTTTFAEPVDPDQSGDTVTFSGTVTSPYGVPTDGGTVTVWEKYEDDGSYTQKASGVPIDLSTGAWSVSHSYDDVGRFQFYAEYVATGSGPEQGSTSPVVDVTVGLDDMGLLYKAGASHTSCRFNWTAIPGATHYDIHDGANLVKTVTSPDSGSISVSQNTTYSPYFYFNGGRPEQRSTGSQDDIFVSCTASGQWRKCCGWNERGDKVLQGYYPGFGHYGDYRGTIDYGNDGVKDRIIAVIGSAKYNGGYATGANIWLYENSGVGDSAQDTIYFYTSDSNLSGGAPNRAAGPHTDKSPGWNSGKWMSIGKTLAQRLAKGWDRSVTLYNNSSANYVEFGGRSQGANDCDMRIDYYWNYVTQSYIAPEWWR